MLAFAGAMPRASAKTEILKWLRTRLKTVLGVIGYKQSSPAIEARVDFAIRAELRRASKEELAAMPLVCPAWLTDAALQTAYLNVDGLPIIADGDRAAVVADAVAAAVRRPCAFAAFATWAAKETSAPPTPSILGGNGNVGPTPEVQQPPWWNEVAAQPEVRQQAYHAHPQMLALLDDAW